MKIADSISDLIGNTPLLRLHRIESKYGCRARLYAKLEKSNPAGSAKDRIALHMLNTAEKEGRLSPGATIIEPTSGNTGIGLAAVAASRGYRVVLTMPETMSVERRMLLQAYGAELVLTEGAKGMTGAVEKAQQLHNEIPGSILAGQFDNPANPEAHYLTTGPEIFTDTDGEVDAFVAGVGTGGTITGTGKYLKEKKPSVRIVGVEPAASPLLTKGKAGAHGLQGIGANFIPAALDVSIMDEILTVTEEEAYTLGRDMATREGIMVGITSGAALFAAVELAKREDYFGKNIVVLMSDTGERYLSSDMFNN